MASKKNNLGGLKMFVGQLHKCFKHEVIKSHHTNNCFRVVIQND